MIKPFEKKLAGWFPFAWLLKRSKQIVLPGFESVPLYDVMYFFRGQIDRIGFSSRSAAISFNILMALPAGLIFLCTLVPYLPSAVHFERNLLRALAQILNNNSTYSSLSGIIHDFFTTQRSGLLSFSFIAAIFFSSNAMMGIMRTFDRSYFEERSSRFLAKRWTAIKLTSLLMLLVFGTVLLLATQGSVRKFLLRELELDTPVVRSIIQTIRWILITLLNYFSIAFIYRLAPAVKNKWPLLSPGAILATVLTFTTSYLFGLWVEHFGQFNKVYGSIGTMLIVMNLVYINALVLIIGFELNVSITAVKAKLLMEHTKENKSKDNNSPIIIA
jgi:membrane protein